MSRLNLSCRLVNALTGPARHHRTGSRGLWLQVVQTRTSGWQAWFSVSIAKAEPLEQPLRLAHCRTDGATEHRPPLLQTTISGWKAPCLVLPAEATTSFLLLLVT